MIKPVMVPFFLLGILLFNYPSQKEKKVIAVQALFQEENVIDSIRLKALSYEGVSSARANGARPHMTIASFRLTEGQISELSDTFTALNKKYRSYQFDVKMFIEEKEKVREYYLVPVFHDSVLIDIHDSLYFEVDNGYERQRKMDMPGSWWPHISLFEVTGNSGKIPKELETELRNVERVTIKGFSLVRFGPMKYFNEIKTR